YYHAHLALHSFPTRRSSDLSDNNDNFYYGIDGPWTAHTVYEPNFYDAIVDGKTVERDGLQVKADGKNSHQYVYGGLRMGGRSYRSEEHTSELQSRENLVCRL